MFHGAKASGKAVGKVGGGFNADFKRPEVSLSHETYLRCTHVAYEPTRDGVGLGHPVERYLACTGRSDGGWDGRKLQMTHNPRDHRLVGDGGHDAE